MIVSMTTLKTANLEICLLGDLHFPHIAELEKKQMRHIAEMVNHNTDDVLIESAQPMSIKYLALLGKDARHHSANHILLLELPNFFKQRGISFTDLSKVRNSEILWAFHMYMLTQARRACSYMNLAEFIAQTDKNLHGILPDYYYGSVENWCQNIKKLIDEERQKHVDMNLEAVFSKKYSQNAVLKATKNRLDSLEHNLNQAKKLLQIFNKSAKQISALSLLSQIYWQFALTEKSPIPMWDPLLYALNLNKTGALGVELMCRLASAMVGKDIKALEALVEAMERM